MAKINSRVATVTRKTAETDIALTLAIECAPPALTFTSPGGGGTLSEGLLATTVSGPSTKTWNSGVGCLT